MTDLPTPGPWELSTDAQGRPRIVRGEFEIVVFMMDSRVDRANAQLICTCVSAWGSADALRTRIAQLTKESFSVTDSVDSPQEIV